MQIFLTIKILRLFCEREIKNVNKNNDRDLFDYNIFLFYFFCISCFLFEEEKKIKHKTQNKIKKKMKYFNFVSMSLLCALGLFVYLVIKDSYAVYWILEMVVLFFVTICGVIILKDAEKIELTKKITQLENLLHRSTSQPNIPSGHFGQHPILINHNSYIPNHDTPIDPSIYNVVPNNYAYTHNEEQQQQQNK
jgi:hypothetical protein